MRKSLFTVMLMSSSLFSATVSLQSGWNLVGTNSQMTLAEIKSSVGSDNLLVVQGPVKTYQKAYVDAGTEFLNDFTTFEIGKGYWIKVTSSATLTYTPATLTGNETQAFQAGWNLISPLSLDDLTTIKTKIGSNNLLVVQGPVKTYQKAYVDAGTEFLNDFTSFETGKGYWVKLDSIDPDLHLQNFIGRDADFGATDGINSEVDDLYEQSILIMSNNSGSLKTELITFGYNGSTLSGTPPMPGTDGTFDYRKITLANFSAATLNSSDSEIASAITTAVSSGTDKVCGNYNLTSTDNVINMTPDSGSLTTATYTPADGNLTIGTTYSKVVYYGSGIEISDCN